MTHKTKKSLHNKTIKSSNSTAIEDDIATTKSESRVWLEEYKEYFTHRMQPVTAAFLERIATELILYAETTEDLLRVDAFFLKKRISLKTVDGWRDRYPEFKTAYNLARRLIAMRKEAKYLNSAIVMSTMGRDDDEYDAWLTKQAEQKLVIQKKLEDEDSDNHLIIEIKEIKR